MYTKKQHNFRISVCSFGSWSQLRKKMEHSDKMSIKIEVSTEADNDLQNMPALMEKVAGTSRWVNDNCCFCCQKFWQHPQSDVLYTTRWSRTRPWVFCTGWGAIRGINIAVQYHNVLFYWLQWFTWFIEFFCRSLSRLEPPTTYLVKASKVSFPFIRS